MGWREQGQTAIAAGPGRLGNLGGGRPPETIRDRAISGISYLEIRAVAGMVANAEARFGVAVDYTDPNDKSDNRFAPIAPTMVQRFSITPMPTVFSVHADESVTIRMLQTQGEILTHWSWLHEFSGGRRRLRLLQDYTDVSVPPVGTNFPIPPGFDDIFFIENVGGQVQWNVQGLLSTAYVPGLMTRDPIGGDVLFSTLTAGRCWLEGDAK
tara:strand:- start:2218 stop:2850 length:633 start_codon:yes stop_codon:yes gene_type:complete